VCLLIALVLPSPCFSPPLTLQTTKDEVTEGFAVLTGDLATVPVGLVTALTAALPNGADRIIGNSRSISRSATSFDIAEISGSHISSLLPVAAIPSPGPLLLIGGGAAYADLDAVSGNAPAPLVKTAMADHDVPSDIFIIRRLFQSDIMTSTLIDINANSKSVLLGDGKEVRMTVAFIHTPKAATATLVLTAVGIMLLLDYVRKRKYS
jgi:hypothetical protein